MTGATPAVLVIARTVPVVQVGFVGCQYTTEVTVELEVHSTWQTHFLTTTHSALFY